MPRQVYMGDMMSCSFGLAPSSLIVLPHETVNSGQMPAANIMDNKPLVNIMPFGMCSSLANPNVAAATSAALGVLTPMPCVPVIPAPWAQAPESTIKMIANMPALNSNCTLNCAWGGVISIL